jgi:hypothetical protein
LDLDLFLISLFLKLAGATGSLRLTAPTCALSLLLLLDLVIHSPPFAEVGESNLIGEFGWVGNWIDGKGGRPTCVLAGHISVNVGGRRRDATRSFISPVATGRVIIPRSTTSRLISVDTSRRTRSATGMTTVMPYMRVSKTKERDWS